jgi:MOSC domain-containing protein YiiM
MSVRHLSYAELEAGLPEIQRSPRERGSLAMIVRRPQSGEREVLEVGELDVEHGLVGDRWGLGKRRRTNQLTLINSRLAALIAQSRDRWPLAGDQLYVDFDLSLEHLPPGSRVAIGAAEIEVSPEPHTGCRLFRERYGEDAHRLVNSADGRAWQLRGINACVVKSGRVQVGDDVLALFA